MQYGSMPVYRRNFQAKVTVFDGTLRSHSFDAEGASQSRLTKLSGSRTEIYGRIIAVCLFFVQKNRLCVETQSLKGGIVWMD